MSNQVATLADDLRAYQQKSIANKTDAQNAVMRDATQQLITEQRAKNAVQVGQSAPDFTLPAVDGQAVTLSDLLSQQPVVLTFYRGGWCPYCNMQLRAYQAILPQIQAQGAALVAVSPETPDNSLSTAEKLALDFTVLSDAGNAVARTYGLVFKLTDDLRDLYSNDLNINLERANGDDAWELPMPGTFVIDAGGTVRHAFVPEDYTQRDEPAAILAALDALS